MALEEAPQSLEGEVARERNPVGASAQQQTTHAFQPLSHAHVPFLHSQQGESSEISKSLCSAFVRG